MNHLCIGKRDLQTTNCVYCCSQCIKIYSSIIRNIQIQVGIQHGNSLLRTTVCISCICLGISIIANIQKRITVNRYQTYLLCIIVNAGNDHGITVLRTQRRILGSVVNTEQCICSVACHLGSCIIGNYLGIIESCLFAGRFCYFVLYKLVHPG